MSHHHHHHKHHNEQPQEEIIVVENGFGQEEVIIVEEQPPAPVVIRQTAFCNLSPKGLRCDGGSDEGNKTRGFVKFIQESPDSHCFIEYRVTGLKPGRHGFHIHEFSDFSNGCMSAGPHYNPHRRNHGGREDSERHVGDLGNIEANHKGVADGRFTDHLIKLSGEHSVVGRSVMVHADPDDCGRGGHKDSLTTGNAGARIACGEVLLGEQQQPMYNLYEEEEVVVVQQSAPQEEIIVVDNGNGQDEVIVVEQQPVVQEEIIVVDNGNGQDEVIVVEQQPVVQETVIVESIGGGGGGAPSHHHKAPSHHHKAAEHHKEHKKHHDNQSGDQVEEVVILQTNDVGGVDNTVVIEEVIVTTSRDKEAFLQKRARNRGIRALLQYIFGYPWTQRKIILKEDKKYLKYYEGEDLRGEISLEGLCAREQPQDQTDGRDFGFGVFDANNDLVIMLAANSKEEQLTWIGAINAVSGAGGNI